MRSAILDRPRTERSWRLSSGQPLVAIAACLALAVSIPLMAADPPGFEDSVLPLFESRCVACHSADGGQAGLSLASLEGVLRGGQSGPAVVPGNPQESLLLSKVSGDKPAMPLVGEPLSEPEVHMIRRWIEGGLQAGTARGAAGESSTWWSFRPLTRPLVPAAGGKWARNEIDHFILARLHEEGLHPSAEADRATLIRRLTFNLHGLPPRPDQVEAFVADPDPQAYERLVDRLLASPRYGERWGRHWLDVVHYGESHGYDKDKARRNSWPYRDYVIQSFNADKPYRLFIQEQLAGDVLYPRDPEGLIATGFIAAGPWDYVGHAELREGTKDKELARLLDRDDMVAATMSTFNSLTVHCARCHDHKFDPIQQEDYFALQAVFSGVDRAEQPYFTDPRVHAKGRNLWNRIGNAENTLRPFRRMIDAAESPEIGRIDKEIVDLSEESADLLPKVGEVDTPETVKRRAEIGKRIQELRERREQLAVSLMDPESRTAFDDATANLASLETEFKSLGEPAYVYSAASYFRTHGKFTPAWEPRAVHVLAKGDVQAPGKRALPGAVTAVPGLAARFAVRALQRGQEGSARADLADWLSDPRNPLTWRSIANRVWHYHFGRGLVETPNDFGRMGSQPTHPDLLDWLAVEFRDSGGSIKALHRSIVLSATYRQASSGNPAHARIDGGNRYLWRMNRLRLDAEAVRDSLLWVGGQLDLRMGGPSAEHFAFKDDHSPIYDYARFDVQSPATRRRSVYRFLVRSVQDPFMESLDCADPSLLVPKRSTTLTAIQALALLNDPLVVSQSRHFAARLRQHAASTEDRIDRGFRLAFGRGASDEERQALAAHADEHGLENAVRLLLNSNQFIFVD